MTNALISQKVHHICTLAFEKTFSTDTINLTAWRSCHALTCNVCTINNILLVVGMHSAYILFDQYYLSYYLLLMLGQGCRYSKATSKSRREAVGLLKRHVSRVCTSSLCSGIH